MLFCATNPDAEKEREDEIYIYIYIYLRRRFGTSRVIPARHGNMRLYVKAKRIEHALMEG
jgi:hypothetical protein